MTRLTVMQVLPALDSGGVERGTFEIAEALVRAGHRSLVVSAGGMLVAPLEATGSRHFKLPVGEKSPRVLTTVNRLRHLIEGQHVHIVHARSRLPAWIAWRAMRSIDPRPKFVTTLHGLNSVSRYSGIMTRGDRVIAVSESSMNYWLSHYPDLTADRVELIFRGIDSEQFPFGAKLKPEKAQQIRQSLELPEGIPVLTLPGRITERKGHKDFVNLTARLKAEGVDCRSLVVGDFKKTRSDFKRRLDDRIDRLDVRDRVIFAGHRDQVRNIYALSDIVYCLSTRPESFGRTAAEALAMGRPVIGYDHGGVGEVLGNLYPEGLVPVGDQRALLEKTEAFLANGAPEVPDRQPYLKSEMQSRTLALYQSLVG